MKETWKIFIGYLLVLLLIIITNPANAQISLVHYNADWNKANDVSWVSKLTDCDIKRVDIAKEPKEQAKHKIVVVPTIVIFVDGEEVKRFQADISFAIKEEQAEIQEVIDEILMSDF